MIEDDAVYTRNEITVRIDGDRRDEKNRFFLFLPQIPHFNPRTDHSLLLNVIELPYYARYGE